MERRMNALACAALLLSCMLGFASVIDAYHGHAFASHPRKSTDPSSQAACMKNLLLQSDFYPTPSIAVTSSMWIRTLSTKTLAADALHSWYILAYYIQAFLFLSPMTTITITSRTMNNDRRRTSKANKQKLRITSLL